MSATVAAQDRAAYANWQTSRLAEFQDWCGGLGAVWHAGKIAAAERAGRGPRDTSDTGVFVGPWHTIEPYVTDEFRIWVTDGVGQRLTWSEFQRMAIELRASERETYRDYVDSKQAPLDGLEELRRLRDREDELIRSARERGASFAELQAVTGMSRMTLHRRLTKIAAPAEVSAGWGEEF